MYRRNPIWIFAISSRKQCAYWPRVSGAAVAHMAIFCIHWAPNLLFGNNFVADSNRMLIKL